MKREEDVDVTIFRAGSQGLRISKTPRPAPLRASHRRNSFFCLNRHKKITRSSHRQKKGRTVPFYLSSRPRLSSVMEEECRGVQLLLLPPLSPRSCTRITSPVSMVYHATDILYPKVRMSCRPNASLTEKPRSENPPARKFNAMSCGVCSVFMFSTRGSA